MVVMILMMLTMLMMTIMLGMMMLMMNIIIRITIIIMDDDDDDDDEDVKKEGIKLLPSPPIPRAASFSAAACNCHTLECIQLRLVLVWGAVQTSGFGAMSASPKQNPPASQPWSVPRRAAKIGFLANPLRFERDDAARHLPGDVPYSVLYMRVVCERVCKSVHLRQNFAYVREFWCFVGVGGGGAAALVPPGSIYTSRRD
jgi:hypothetical protein